MLSIIYFTLKNPVHENPQLSKRKGRVGETKYRSTGLHVGNVHDN